jgi:hypothetical protein
METIKLYTKSGEFVGEATVPIFQPRADVVLWGERYFGCVNGSDRYVELFVAVAMENFRKEAEA